jgi:hypothetical protein
MISVSHPRDLGAIAFATQSLVADEADGNLWLT